MSLMDKLKEKEEEKNAGYDVLFWKPEPGEVIEGAVTEMGETITEYGDAEYLQVETEDGKKFMVFLNSVLRKQTVAEDVKVGDRVAIKYLGQVQSKKKNRKFNDYVLVKDEPSESEEAA